MPPAIHERTVSPDILASLFDALPGAVAVYADPAEPQVWANAAAVKAGVPSSLLAADDCLQRIPLADDHTALVWTPQDDGSEHEAAALRDEMQRFAYVISHDLQAPARTVAAYLDLLIEEHGDMLQGEAREFVDFAVDGAHVMQQLLGGILAWSRVASHGREPVDASCEDAVEMALFDLETAIGETGAVVHRDALPQVRADRAQLLDLFKRLIDNGLKFHRGQPVELHIAAVRQGPHWRIDITDNGIGIEARHFDRIFELFQRLHTAEEYPGVGAGLAVCKRIVARHGGRLWLRSEVDVGTTVSFTLPAVADDVGAT